jgi:hypothetical protein
VLRVLVALILLTLAPQLGSAAGVPLERCEETCPDDDPQGNCAPDCDDCSCCNHLRSPLASHLQGASGAIPQQRFSPGTALPPESPEPAEIGHVPIALLG